MQPPLTRDETNLVFISIQEEEQDAAELVAQRTRSKMPLKDTPLEEIEQNFVAPDITADMYDTSFVDQDWCDFLSGLTKSSGQFNILEKLGRPY